MNICCSKEGTHYAKDMRRGLEIIDVGRLEDAHIMYIINNNT